MNRRITPLSAYAYAVAVAAAALAATLMSGRARAEGPIDYPQTTFASTRTVAEVQAELKAGRSQLDSYAIEWRLQEREPLASSGYTPQQARADYLAAREEVRAFTGEDSGSSYLARMRRHAPAAAAMASRQY